MKIFSLSTSWNSASHDNGHDLVSDIKEIGFDTIELGFALTESVVSDILSLKKTGGITVSSLHNICPLPSEIEPRKASPDYYSLASGDESERQLAVNVTKNTILWAKKFNAKAVVIHCGRIQLKDRTRDLASLVLHKDEFDKMRLDMIRERSEKKNGYLDNVIKSLSELVPFAEASGIMLGLENRYYYREIPIMEEFEIIFEKFNSKNLGYWHDVGHAEVFERLGLVLHKDLLNKFRDRLIGMHMHDIIGVIKDHNPPGMGTFEFSMLKPYLKSDVIKVVEIHQPASADDIRTGIEYLSRILE